MQRNRAIEISELLRDPSMPLKSIIKKYGFTSHGHFSLFCRKFLGDTPRALRRRSHLATSPVTLEDVKKNMERQSRQKAATKKAATGEAPRRRGRPRKNEVR
jgi:AraC-like DNA-binding protein